MASCHWPIVLSGTVTLGYLLPATEALVVAAAPASPLLLAYVLLGYPTGLLPGRAERVALGVMAIVFALLAVAVILTLEPAAHGTSLRALEKYLSNIADDQIVSLEIPTGKPIVYELGDDLSVRERYYLGER